jgi:hypothetical protein
MFDAEISNKRLMICLVTVYAELSCTVILRDSSTKKKDWRFYGTVRPV